MDNVTRRGAISGLVGASVTPHVQSAQLAAATAQATNRFYGIAAHGGQAAAIAAGETATPVGQAFSVDDGGGNLIIRERTVGGSVEVARMVTPASMAGTTGLAQIGTAENMNAQLALNARARTAIHRAALAALPLPAIGQTAVLAETRREGTFVAVDYAGVAALTATDTEQGIFVRSTENPEIAWVRQYSGALDVRWFGAVGNGLTLTDGGKIQLAMNVAAAMGGGFVFCPRGIYFSTQKLMIPNRVHLKGEHYSCTTIRAAPTFNQTALITNLLHDGTQQYASITNLGFDGNRANGAVCSTAVVHICSVFEGSVFDQVIATEGSNVGFKVEIANGFGPVEFGSLWCLSNTNKNFFCEVTGTGNAGNGINIANLTAEHQNSAGVSIEFKNTTSLNILVGVRIENIHIEQRNSGAGTKCIRLDGVTNFSVGKIELLCGSPTSHIGIEITANIFNQFIDLRHITNANLINPVINDLKHAVTYGAVSVPYYSTPDVGLFRQGYQTLPYAASITPNIALGNYCILVVTDANPITINPPSNAASAHDIYFEIVNASGGPMGPVTWNASAYPYISWTNPANGKRRLVHLHRRSTTAFAQVGQVTPDL